MAGQDNPVYGDAADGLQANNLVAGGGDRHLCCPGHDLVCPAHGEDDADGTDHQPFSTCCCHCMLGDDMAIACCYGFDGGCACLHNLWATHLSRGQPHASHATAVHNTQGQPFHAIAHQGCYFAAAALKALYFILFLFNV